MSFPGLESLSTAESSILFHLRSDTHRVRPMAFQGYSMCSKKENMTTCRALFLLYLSMVQPVQLLKGQCAPKRDAYT